MRKLMVLSLAFAISLLAAGSFLTSKTSGQKSKFKRSNQPIANQYIVVLNDDVVGRFVSPPEVDAEAQFLSSLYGGSVKAVFSSALRGYSVTMSQAEAESLSRNDRVLFVEEDSVIGISSTQTNAPWNLDRVDQRAMPLDTTYNYVNTGVGAHIYILDTGIRISHQEFGGRASVSHDVLNDGQNGLDCNGHGTHVAGTAGGITYGAAKGALLHSVRVLPCNGSGAISQLIAGIDWVTANRSNPAVANISITAPGSSPALDSAVTASVSSGVVYTIAAGNDQWNACDYSPARTSTAITVGATAEADDRALYSNYGPCIDLFAPGNAITSAGIGSDSATRVLSGTSMSAPLVAGVAAIYRASNPSANPSSVAQAITSASTTGVVTNIGGTSSPNKLLYSSLAGSPPATPTPTPTPTPTVTPTPTPGNGRVTIKKRVHTNGGPATVATFPYQATNIATPAFTLVNNQEFTDPSVPPSAQVVAVTEESVNGWRLLSVECVETAGGSPNVPNTTVDLANRRANIKVENDETVTCTFTSEEIAPTAAHAEISGRVVNAQGSPMRGVRLILLNASSGETVHAMTNNFGYYSFVDLELGNFYVMTAINTKRYWFSNNQRSFTLIDDLSNVDFVADPSQ